LTNRPRVFTNLCCRPVNDQFSILFGSTSRRHKFPKEYAMMLRHSRTSLDRKRWQRERARDRRCVDANAAKQRMFCEAIEGCEIPSDGSKMPHDRADQRITVGEIKEPEIVFQPGAGLNGNYSGRGAGLRCIQVLVRIRRAERNGIIRCRPGNTLRAEGS